MKGYPIFSIIFLCYLSAPGTSQQMSRGELRLMCYNVENLFYPGSDSLAGSESQNHTLNPDEEFTPEGIRRWSWKRYRTKLTALAKVIVAAGNWEPPEVVGLCEVEETRVLEDLVQHPILEPYAYEFVHKDSRDHRGMDVACLYRKDRISLVEWSTHSPDKDEDLASKPQGQSTGQSTGQSSGQSSGNSSGRLPGIPADITQGTRDMLHLCFSWGKKDSLDLFLVHLVSKYGGAGATANRRRKQVEYLLHLADSVHIQRPGSLKILSGDFNESYEGYSMEPFRRARRSRDTIFPVPLTGADGSYKYRGSWSQIDLFLMTGSNSTVLPTTAARSANSYQIKGSILGIPPLLTSDEKYGGWKPYRTYEGYAYAGGVSDHLPLILDISNH